MLVNSTVLTVEAVEAVVGVVAVVAVVAVTVQALLFHLNKKNEFNQQFYA